MPGLSGGAEFAGPENGEPKRLQSATRFKESSEWAFSFPFQLCGSCGRHAQWLPRVQNTEPAHSACIRVNETQTRSFSQHLLHLD